MCITYISTRGKGFIFKNFFFYNFLKSLYYYDEAFFYMITDYLFFTQDSFEISITLQQTFLIEKKTSRISSDSEHFYQS